MENIMIAAILAAMIHGHVTGGEKQEAVKDDINWELACLLYTSPSPRDLSTSRMPSSA